VIWDDSSVPTTLGGGRGATKQEVRGHFTLMTAEDHRGYVSFVHRIEKVFACRSQISQPQNKV
jgi:hypothetical protein